MSESKNETYNESTIKKSFIDVENNIDNEIGKSNISNQKNKKKKNEYPNLKNSKEWKRKKAIAEAADNAKVKQNLPHMNEEQKAEISSIKR
jgi:hypothetical protein